MPKAANYWLIKSEPDVFSFDDLLNSPGQCTLWDGVRNYQARNYMRDGMKCGDKVLFYHSNCQPPAVVGIAEVVREAYPDPSQFDPESKYFDAKASPEKPRWLAVDVKALSKLKRPVSLAALKQEPELAGLKLLQRGNRLSVMPLEHKDFVKIVAMAEQSP